MSQADVMAKHRPSCVVQPVAASVGRTEKKCVLLIKQRREKSVGFFFYLIDTQGKQNDASHKLLFLFFFVVGSSVAQ